MGMREKGIRWALRALKKRLTKGSTAWMVLPAILAAIPATGVNAATQQEVADYVRDNILGGDLRGVNLWMTETPLDQTHVARDIDPAIPDIPFPYPLTWLVMIDDNPEANWGHPARCVFVNDNLLEHTPDPPLDKFWPPSVFTNNGAGLEVNFGCAGVTPGPCQETGPGPAPGGAQAAEDQDCLYAVLISGGWRQRSNYSRYANNLGRMYRNLRGCGYPKENISVYYSKGGPLDLDDLDGDGDHTTGNDVTGGTTQSAVRQKIQNLCMTLDPDRDVLFIYVTNHGKNNKGAMLWDDGDRRVEDNEIYTPEELGMDTADCKVCRLFMILDQCFSGEFLSIANDGDHANAAIYVAATGAEPSWGSEYLDAWDDNDPSTTTMNDMHPAMLPNSEPGMSEGTAGNGDVSLCVCWEVPAEFGHPPEESGLKWISPFPYQRNIRYDFAAGADDPPQYFGEDDPELQDSDFVIVDQGTLDWIDQDPAFPGRQGMIGIDNRNGTEPRTTVIRIHLDNWDRAEPWKKDVWKEVEWVVLGGASVVQRHDLVPPGFEKVENWSEEQDLGNGWRHGDFWWKIEPNPPWEEIEITYFAPPGGIVMDDFIHVATECVIKDEGPCGDGVCQPGEDCENCSQDCTCVEVGCIASGADQSLDGYLAVAPDGYGSFTSVDFGGGDGGQCVFGDNFNPNGAAGLREAVFTDGFVLYIAGANQRELLSTSSDWRGLLDDASLDSTAGLVMASDSDGDGVDDTATSAFTVTGAGVALDFELTQEVEEVGGGVSTLTQTYMITNNGGQAVDFVLLRQADYDLLWDPDQDFANDSVGTGTNGSPECDRHVYQVESGLPETAITVSSPQSDVYYGSKRGVAPDGGLPYGFGTDFQQWDAYGVPVGWSNNIAGVGNDTDGESGPAPAGCTSPCDGAVGLSIPVSLAPGDTTAVIIMHTYGANVPANCSAGCGPCPTDVDGNGKTEAADLAFLLGNWGPVPPDADPAVLCLDADDDGAITAFDLAVLLGGWGQCPDQKTGGCCLPGDSWCYEGVTDSECLLLEGVYGGDGSLCEAELCGVPAPKKCRYTPVIAFAGGCNVVTCPIKPWWNAMDPNKDCEDLNPDCPATNTDPGSPFNCAGGGTCTITGTKKDCR